MAARTFDFVLRAVLSTALCLCAVRAGATDHAGRVIFGGLPVPGATVTAIQRDGERVTITDQDGVFRFAALDEGSWTIRVEMLGFASATQDVTVIADAPASAWELKLLPLAEMTRGLTPAAARPVPARPASATSNRAANSEIGRAHV